MSSPAPNPLIAAPDDEDAQPLDNAEGAGIFSSVADVNEAVTEDDHEAMAFGYVGLGIDALGMAMNPLQSLFSAGVGWLIEHISFLHEPLDALCGDPTRITAQAKTWHAVAGELRATADGYDAAMKSVSSWQGLAADGYRAAVRDLQSEIRAGAGGADEVADSVLFTAAMVGTVRALIRDTIADFVGKILAAGVGAIAASIISAGTSLAALALWVTGQAVQLAAKISTRIGKLLDDLAESAGKLATTTSKLESLSGKLMAGGGKVRAAGHVAAGAVQPAVQKLARENPLGLPAGVQGAEQVAGGLAPAAAVEAGKSDAKFRQERAELATPR